MQDESQTHPGEFPLIVQEEEGEDNEEELLCGEIEHASDDDQLEEEEMVRLTPGKRGRTPGIAKPAKTRGRPKAKRVIDEDYEDEYLEADEEIADPDALLAEEEDLLADPEEEDEESEYAVRGTRRKAKLTRKARGGALVSRSSAPRGSKRGGGAVTSVTRGASGSRGKSVNPTTRGRKKAAPIADDDDEFINDGEPGAAAEDELEHEENEEDEEDEENADEDGVKGGEKGEETVFIDNLPNDEYEIRTMLKEVKKHIKQLERQFFEEEDSEKEEELKQISNNNNTKHEEALAAFR